MRLGESSPKFATPFHQSFAMSTLRSSNQACGTAVRAFSFRRLGWTTSLRTPPGEASTPSRSWIARCQDSACVALRAGLWWWIGRGPSALLRERRTASRSVRVTQVRHSRSASQPTLLVRRPWTPGWVAPLPSSGCRFQATAVALRPLSSACTSIAQCGAADG